MSRHVWIDQGAELQVAKLNAHGITRVYFDARDTPWVPESPFERGIYRVQSWDNLSPTYLAGRLSTDVTKWGGDPRKQLAVHANIELHDPAYIVAFLKEWRRLRPYRETALVIEGMQGGWFTDELRTWVNYGNPNGLLGHGFGIDVLAEAYTGPMGPLDPDEVRSDLENYGVARSRCLVMYDAAKLKTRWDGCAFTQQRLP
jgi:hypothetical protein